MTYFSTPYNQSLANATELYAWVKSLLPASVFWPAGHEFRLDMLYRAGGGIYYYSLVPFYCAYDDAAAIPFDVIWTKASWDPTMFAYNVGPGACVPGTPPVGFDMILFSTVNPGGAPFLLLYNATYIDDVTIKGNGVIPITLSDWSLE